MITRVPGWSWDVRGGVVTLAPLDGGPALGSIRYRERIAPLRTVAEILDHKDDGTAGPVELGAVEPLTTLEGEYGAAIDVRSARGQYTLGVVYGDDWYAEIVGLTAVPEQFARFARQVRDLVRNDRLALGPVRRRRFEYRAPRGWHGHTRLPQFVTWFPPDHPANPTSITVYPALPASPDMELGFHALYVGPPAPAEVVRERTPRAELLAGGLAGLVWELDVIDEARRPLVRRVVILRDDRFVYPLYLDAPADGLAPGLAAFEEVLASIRPLPRPGVHAAGGNDLFAHWT